MMSLLQMSFDFLPEFQLAYAIFFVAALPLVPINLFHYLPVINLSTVFETNVLVGTEKHKPSVQLHKQKKAFQIPNPYVEKTPLQSLVMLFYCHVLLRNSRFVNSFIYETPKTIFSIKIKDSKKIKKKN